LENLVSDALVAARALYLASTATLAGLFLFLFFVGEPAFRVYGAAPANLRRIFLRMGWGSLGLALAFGAVWFLLLAFDLAGRSWNAVISQAVPWTLLTETRFGNNALVRLGLAVLLSICLLRFRPDRGWRSHWDGPAAVVLAACLAGSLAWAGHGGSGTGTAGRFQLAADAVHLLAATAWIGGLPPMLLLLAFARRTHDDRSLALGEEASWRFYHFGLISVATLLATGILNSVFLVGSVPGLVGTDYGHLLLVKQALFAVMVCFAAANRFRLLPRLFRPEYSSSIALGRIECNGLAELVLGLIVLVIVGALGTMPPAAHVQAWWPFSLRLSTNALQEPGGGEVITALAAVGVGGVAIVAAIVKKSWRWPMFAAAAVLLVWGGPRLSLLTAVAFPTTFFVSSTGYSAHSIAAGRTVFAERCASCHGARGRGDGPAAKNLERPPSDLTAEHIYGHSDGDLFWWISHGIGEAMPGFDAVLDETARWNLVDFLHANADARRLAEAADATPVALPLPQFSIECRDGSIVSIDRLRGNVVHLVFPGASSAKRLRQLAGTHAGHETILARAKRADAAPFCRTEDPDVSAAFALYRRSGAIDGTEFLIDASGWLRAMWFPGRRPNWEKPEVLASQIAAIGHTAGRPRPTAGAHVHSH
jgi:putative copper export protein/mono/diheme cytochrome c family protein